MLFKRLSTTNVLRWVWGPIEVTHENAYLLGTLTAAVGLQDATITFAESAPLPATLPIQIYIDGETMMGTALNGAVLSVTRTTPATHAVGAKVSTDSYAAVARDYSTQYLAPQHFGMFALSFCEMNQQQMAACAQDSRMITLPSMQSPTPVPTAVTTALAQYGAVSGLTTYGLLEALAATEPQFTPDI